MTRFELSFQILTFILVFECVKFQMKSKPVFPNRLFVQIQNFIDRDQRMK